MNKLTDLISNLKSNTLFDKALSGEDGPSGAFDGPPLPTDREYRVVVDKAEYKAAKGSGRMQFVMTYEVQEPEEFKGRKLQEYADPAPSNDMASDKIARLLGALKVNLDGWGDDDMDGFIQSTVGTTLVVALNIWGTENDRNGVRWTNTDRGQKLKTDVKPVKPKGGGKNLRADINIPKDEPFPETQPPPADTPSLPGLNETHTGGGPKLPPGLK